MLPSLKVKDHMAESPAKVLPGASIFDAITLIIDNRISGVCVVDEQNQLVGVLSEIDCLKAILSNTYNNTGTGTVAEFMTPLEKVTTANIHDEVVAVASDMLVQQHRRRPVVDNGKLVGQITCRRLLRAVKEFT